MIGVCAALAHAQGSADAFAVKIPAASMPSTVTLSASGTNGAPGKTVAIPLSLSLAGGTAPSSFQIDLSFDPTKLTFLSASAGAGLTNAGMGLESSTVSSSDVRLSTTGANQNGIATSVVAYATFLVASLPGTAGTAVTLTNCVSAGTSGNPLSTGCTAAAVAIIACNVTGDAVVGVADVQAIINQALGVSPPTYDLNQDGVVNVADVQPVIDAAMGKGCTL